jgi:hypothetical protein
MTPASGVGPGDDKSEFMVPAILAGCPLGRAEGLTACIADLRDDRVLAAGAPSRELSQPDHLAVLKMLNPRQLGGLQ